MGGGGFVPHDKCINGGRGIDLMGDLNFIDYIIN